MKDEIVGVSIEEFVGFKPKMYLFLVEKSVNKNVVATISHNEFREVLLNKKWHSVKKIQGKDNRIGTDKIKIISLSYFDDQI